MSAITYPQDKERTSVTANSMLERRVKRQTFEMDVDLHSRLKVAAAKEDKYIRDILNEAAKSWLRERGY